MIVSSEVFLLFLLIVVIGYFLVTVIANRKWGYTKKREKELEEKTVRGKKQKP